MVVHGALQHRGGLGRRERSGRAQEQHVLPLQAERHGHVDVHVGAHEHRADVAAGASGAHGARRVLLGARGCGLPVETALQDRPGPPQARSGEPADVGRVAFCDELPRTQRLE